MVWAGISSISRTNLIFVAPGVKINEITYRELTLELEVQVAGSQHFKNSILIFQQDEAPAHTANNTRSGFVNKKLTYFEGKGLC